MEQGRSGVEFVPAYVSGAEDGLDLVLAERQEQGPFGEVGFVSGRGGGRRRSSCPGCLQTNSAAALSVSGTQPMYTGTIGSPGSSWKAKSNDSGLTGTAAFVREPANAGSLMKWPIACVKVPVVTRHTRPSVFSLAAPSTLCSSAEVNRLVSARPKVSSPCRVA